MNKTSNFSAAVSLALALFLPSTFAAPGAHGPNGEHLDAPSAGMAASAAPRFEAKSEAFELVGQLQGAELSLFINRFETNEPVLGAAVEVESGDHKAAAPFRADRGDYAVADQAFLKVLAGPGSHPLVITVAAGSEADLLDGALNIAEEAHGHGNEGSGWRIAGFAVAAALVAAALLWGLKRRRHTPAVHKTAGGAA